MNLKTGDSKSDSALIQEITELKKQNEVLAARIRELEKENKEYAQACDALTGTIADTQKSLNTMCERVRELEPIVKALAEKGPFFASDDDYDSCAFCGDLGHDFVSGERDFDDVEVHQPICAWVLAKKATEGR